MKIKRRSLILAKCPHCGEFMATLVNPGEKAIVCKHCVGTMNLSQWKLYIARTECACCGHKNVFITDGSLKEVTCRECHAPVDLIFNRKDKAFTSAEFRGRKK